MLVYIVIISSLFFIGVIYSLYSILKLYDKKSKEYILDMDNIKLEHDKNLLSTQIEIQEQTFENISREIHDNIGQKLSLIKLNLNTLSKNQHDADLDKINSSANLISTVICDLRHLSHSLASDDILSFGLIKAIEAEIAQLTKSAKYEITFKVSGEQVFLDHKKELILFRIVQEAINNILKHAEATRILIDVQFEKNAFIIQIQDNGKGYQLTENTQGAGLKNIQKRVGMVNGEIEMVTNSGTLINIKIPI